MPNDPSTVVVQPSSNVSQAAISRLVKQNRSLNGGEVYDPQTRTPIKLEGPEMCPHCGQPIPKAPRSMLTAMNNYVNEAGIVITASKEEDTWVADNQVAWYKVTGEVNGKSISKFLPKKESESIKGTDLPKVPTENKSTEKAK